MKGSASRPISAQAPKEASGKGPGGGDKVEQEDEGEGSPMAVRKSVKLIQGYRPDGEREKGNLTQAIFQARRCGVEQLTSLT
jgi:hypothetical protein